MNFEWNPIAWDAQTHQELLDSLPNFNGTYLFTEETPTGELSIAVDDFWRDGFEFDTRANGIGSYTAWMELPEPYKGD